MLCRVKSAVPGQELSWTTVVRNKEMTTWAYGFTPTAGGVEVVESFDVRWYSFTARLAEDFLMLDRNRRREDGMRTTLERIKQLAESTVAP